MRLILAVFALVLAGCSPPPAATYPPTTQANFMRACEAQSTVPGLCGCVWGKIAADVPPADFSALEQLPGPQREASPLKQQIDGYALTCGTELSTEPTATP